VRSAPLTFVTENNVAYTDVDYSRVVKAQNAVMVVNDAEDGETARQPATIPEGQVVLGFGPEATATRAATELLNDAGVRVLSTSGGVTVFEPFPGTVLAENQARAWADPTGRLEATRTLYSTRFVDSAVLNHATADTLRNLAADLADETFRNYASRYRIARFRREPGAKDTVNQTLTHTSALLLNTAADVCRLLGVSTSLGLVNVGHRLAYAQDLADALYLDVTVPIGFLIGAQKITDPQVMHAAVAAEIHQNRVIPKMIGLVNNMFGGDRG
jgi:CRISPR/Cas system-associated endonuclease Cas1